MTGPHWFNALGQPLGDAELAAIDAYSSDLGLASTEPPLVVSSWDALATIIREPSLAWWEREERLRRSLAGSSRPLSADGAWVELNDSIHAAASAAAARFGCADAGLIKAATGAASFAVHDYQLATSAAAGPGHAFVHKYKLFAQGRWPLGRYGGRFAIF